MTIKVGKALCQTISANNTLNFIKQHAKKKWWCAVESDMGTFNIKGYCKNTKDKSANNND
jgi:hypothetical protein